MRAAIFEKFGGPDVISIGERPMPVPKAGEIMVKVAASTVNPSDLLMRTGVFASIMSKLKPPFTDGMEFSGHVYSLGDTSTTLKVGQPVMGLVNPRRQEGGAHAEFVCVPAASVVALHKTADLVEASTMPMNGLTAKITMEVLNLPAGSTLLVTGSAGAIGGYVMELARGAGLHVVADAKDDDRELVTRLGASEIVPRGEKMYAEVRARYPQGVDAAVDAAVIGDPVAALIKEGGTMILLRRTCVISDSRVRAVIIGVLDHAEKTDALTAVAKMFEEGKLTPRVAVRLPYTRTSEGHQLLELGGVRGRVVIEF